MNKRSKNVFRQLLGAPRRPPQVPEGCRLYAIGDIHGCVNLLEQLLQKIFRDAQSAPARRLLVYIGDFVDRGPDSRGVLDCAMNRPEGFDVHYLRGNHDQAVLQFLDDAAFFPIWKTYGGLETLRSYGVAPPEFESEPDFVKTQAEFRAKIPKAHLAFFEALESSFSFGDYFFAHAGVRPGISLEKQDLEDLMWVRDEFLTSHADFGKVVVHGHSPSTAPVRRSNRIGIDTGAYATGKLTAAVLEGTECRFLHA